MLEQLFGSKTRTKLLKIFLLNPDQAFFIRELTRKIDTQINSVRRELQNLMDCNIIEVVQGKTRPLDSESHDEPFNDASDKQPKKFFRLNPHFILYNELRNLFLKSPLLFQDEFVKEIKAYETVDYAVFSGFFVERDDVSVDMLIIGEVPRQRFLKLVTAFEKELGREINFTTMSTEEFLYRKSLGDRFLFMILEGKKMVVLDRLTQKAL